jgi:protein-tyrosine-phosphatase
VSEAGARPRRVLFVCHANTSRSIIAEALLQRMLGERGLARAVEVRSGGIAPYARDGSLVSLDARFVLREVGIELPSAAGATDLKRQRHLLAQADVIVVMTGEQRRMLAAFPEAAGRTVLTLRELAGRSGDIADPSMQDEDVFRRCRDEITQCLARGLERLLAGAPPGGDDAPPVQEAPEARGDVPPEPRRGPRADP